MRTRERLLGSRAKRQKTYGQPGHKEKMFNAVIQVVEKCVERHGEKFLSTSEEGQEAWASNIIGSKQCANVIAKKTSEAIISRTASDMGLSQRT